MSFHLPKLKPISESGFTLVETLVSLTSLLLFFSVVVVTFQLVTNLVGESRVRLVATSLATEKIEAIRNLSFDDVGTLGGIPAGVLAQSEDVVLNGQTFSVTTSVVYIDDPYDGQLPNDIISTDYKRARVAVSWVGAFPSKNPVVMLTDVMPNGLETIVGGGTLFIYIINASGQAVANANVTVVNNAVNPVINLNTVSDNQGRVVLPGAPTCVNCYEISATKSGFTTDRTYATTEVANPLNPHATVIEAELTSLTFQIDQTITLNILTTGSRQNNYPAFPGVQFNIRGTRTIGTNTQDQPVYKYDQNLSSGPGGALVINNLEWDTYTVTIPNPSSVDLAGTYPISPFPLLPGANTNLTIVTTPATANNLLVVVQNIGNQAIATASATLTRPGFIATASAGLAGKGDMGQVLFPGLTAAGYTLTVSQVGYQTASASATVSSDTKINVILQQ